MKPKLLICGDFCRHTGFARVNESLSAQLRDRWDIAVLAVNYRGDYHPLQQHYHIYPAHLGGDLYGMERIAEIVRQEKPDVILVVNDPWLAHGYLDGLAALDNPPPTVLYTPIDALGLRSSDAEQLNGFTHVVAYTRFGGAELRRAGYRGSLAVIPHGIDRDLFHVVDQEAARKLVGVPPDTFAVLIMDANNPRKRHDIAFDAFARFAEGKPENVKLVYHGPLDAGNWGWDIPAMAEDLGISDRLIATHPNIKVNAGVPPEQLKVVYSMCDVKLSTTSGEGWGLTTLEAMACGLPSIVPEFGALAEWANGAAYFIPAETPTRHAIINTVGMVPTAESAALALDILYRDQDLRMSIRQGGLERAAHPDLAWPQVANHFHATLENAMYHVPPATPVQTHQQEAAHAV